ncbi:MAG: hypothetical protein ACUVRM_01590 [Bacillota bacterium]
MPEARMATVLVASVKGKVKPDVFLPPHRPYRKLYKFPLVETDSKPEDRRLVRSNRYCPSGRFSSMEAV